MSGYEAGKHADENGQFYVYGNMRRHMRSNFHQWYLGFVKGWEESQPELPVPNADELRPQYS